MDQFMDILFAVLQAVALAVVPTLAGFAIKFLLAKWSLAKQELVDLVGDQAWYELRRIVEVAVKAAEGAGAAGFIEDKKEYAVQLAHQWLMEQGIEIDLDVIIAAIEAAVLDEFNKDRLAFPK